MNEQSGAAGFGKDDHLDMWKHFQEDASQIKGRLWTIATWLYTLLTGLLGFIAKFFTPIAETSESSAQEFFTQPGVVVLLSFVGMLLCWFTYLMIYSYGKHIITCWKRSNFILNKEEPLNEIWKSGFPGDDDSAIPSLPPEVRKLIGLTIGFGVIYFVVLSVAFMESIQ